MQKQPSCIKRVWPSKSLGEKVVESKVAAIVNTNKFLIMAVCIVKIY